MKPLVIVVGKFRSGTSLVAQICHRLGWQVAPTIPAPGPPSWRSDWEDAALTSALMAGKYPTPQGWRDYLKWRRSVSRATGFEGRIALKSAYLALVWDDLMEVVGEHATTVHVHREEKARQASLAAHPALSSHADRLIGEALKTLEADVHVEYGQLCTLPLWQVASLADSLGVQDDAAVRAAIALVEQPKEYDDGLQPGHAQAADGPRDGDRGPGLGDLERGDDGPGPEEGEAPALEVGPQEEPEERSGA